MKRLVTLVATFFVAVVLLFFVTTRASGQQYQPLPFPQAVNTALASGTAEEAQPAAAAEAPSAMATNAGRHENVDLGSPFPSAANPSLGSTSDQVSPAEIRPESGSPFPSAANPSSNK